MSPLHCTLSSIYILELYLTNKQMQQLSYGGVYPFMSQDVLVSHRYVGGILNSSWFAITLSYVFFKGLMLDRLYAVKRPIDYKKKSIDGKVWKPIQKAIDGSFTHRVILRATEQFSLVGLSLSCPACLSGFNHFFQIDNIILSIGDLFRFWQGLTRQSQKTWHRAAAATSHLEMWVFSPNFIFSKANMVFYGWLW